MIPKAMLFDLDDTLTDRHSTLKFYADMFLLEFGRRMQQPSRQTVLDVLFHYDRGGYDPRRAANIVEAVDWLAPPTVEQVTHHWKREFPKCVRARVGLFEMLDALQIRGIALGIITNGPIPGQDVKIDCLRIRPYFDVVLVSDAIGIKKPDPEIFNMALSRMGYAAEETWFVGDHPENDVLGADTVGMTPVWARYEQTWPLPQVEPGYAIDSLTGLLRLVEKSN
ncbi:MAG: HAD family hydrolase [Pseudomonadota bacterium]